MILRLIVSFAIMLISMYIGIWLQHDAGYVLISFQHWTIESTFWVAIFALFLAISLLFLIFKLLKNILNIPLYWQQWRKNRLLSRAQAKTKRGLIEFGEGQWQTAKKHLIAAAANTDQPLVNYLTAARAAEKLGDHHLRNKYLHLAQTVAPDATIAIELLQAQLQIDNREWKEAAETLAALQIIAPDHPYVLQLCLKLYQETEQWHDLIDILHKLRPSKVVTAEEIHTLKKQAYLALCKTSLKTDSLKLDIEALPKDLKYDPDIVTCYAQYLLSHQQVAQAEKYLRESLKIAVSEPILVLYSKLKHDHSQIRFIESLIKKTPDSASLHLCLGQLFLHNQLWGSAKTHLEKSIQLQPTMQAYASLGELFEILEQESEACQAYKQAIKNAL